MSYYETFSQLHRSSTPFLLGNCWDVNSAKVLEAAGYKAIGFSSHALSTAHGFEDGEQLPFDLLLRMTQKVTESIKVPFTVDMEGGYSRTIDGILTNIDKLHDAGVVGINLEDTIPGQNREFQKTDDFKKIISAVANHLSRHNRDLFLNIRTDAFLLDIPIALAETLTRIKAYENAGASGIFVPCITDRHDIEQVVNATALPINVMCVPGLPEFEVLDLLGVKRISMGPFLFNKVYTDAATLARKVSAEKNLSPLLS
ncbi:isocitrate lyase/PEP mutase family protein [Puia dinghuensis]|uniref:Carboxyvinyl-carboxyphosphonate phosphorylmutase n=1 Tax=Puia dinghuensis TaxID=1792502 RepID=A0A8J2U6B0_9BACT|nr:isocitrate lyase/phosphoenolpyruvate mutase family protein [Puia dinghuensis]GGA81600.1 carboxyvinyl-carboxyphosphonate phosphorylmutase [Puia dinghuensis]